MKTGFIDSNGVQLSRGDKVYFQGEVFDIYFTDFAGQLIPVIGNDNTIYLLKDVHRKTVKIHFPTIGDEYVDALEDAVQALLNLVDEAKAFRDLDGYDLSFIDLVMENVEKKGGKSFDRI